MAGSIYRFAHRKQRARTLSPSERRALAPTVPKSAQVRYLALVAAVFERTAQAVERHLFPLAASFGTPLGAIPREVRQDSWPAVLPCGPVPEWYASALAWRQDAWVPKGDDRFDQAFEALQDELDAISAGLEIPITAVAREVTAHNVRETDRVLGGAPGGAERYQARVQEFVRRNVGLIKSVQASHFARLETAFLDAHSGTARVETIQAELMSTFGLAKAQASLIARDQTLKLNSQITQERQKAAGVDTYVWTSSRDERVRGRPGGLWAKSQSNHWVLDGTVQKWALAPITNPVTGARNHPGEDFQCRCVAVPDTERLLNGERVQVAVPASVGSKL